LPQDRVCCICPFAPFFVSYSAVVGLIFKKEKRKKGISCSLFAKGNPDSQSIYATYYCCDIESVSIPTEGSGG
jgi:hypothetical protein